MSDNNEKQGQLSGQANKLVVGLLSTSIIFAGAALLGVWKQSDLTEQRLDAVDDKHVTALRTVDKKYIEKSERVIKRVNVLASSLASHFSDDNAHQLMIQREHLIFEGFMDKLEDAHVDIEELKHKCSNIERFGCPDVVK